MDKVAIKKDIESTVLDDPSASFWLKEQIVSTNERDILKAMRDTETLLLVLHARWNKMADQRN